MKFAIIGSATDVVSEEIRDLCIEVGAYLALKNIAIATGGSHGIPGLVVQSAFKRGAKTEAYSPDKNEEQHRQRKDNLPPEFFERIQYIPGFTARSLEMLKNVDGVIVIGGRIGTLSEFTIALEEGINVAVIKNSGGIADHLEYIVSIARKEFSNKVIFETHLEVAINTLIESASQHRIHER
jgi:uncharacterized protein (TIGR00725 family)